MCSRVGPEPPPRSQTSMLLRTGGLGLFCTLHAGIHGLRFHAGPCGLEGGTEIGVPSLGSCVSALPVLQHNPEQGGIVFGAPSLGSFGNV